MAAEYSNALKEKREAEPKPSRSGNVKMTATLAPEKDFTVSTEKQGNMDVISDSVHKISDAARKK